MKVVNIFLCHKKLCQYRMFFVIVVILQKLSTLVGTFQQKTKLQIGDLPSQSDSETTESEISVSKSTDYH